MMNNEAEHGVHSGGSLMIPAFNWTHFPINPYGGLVGNQ